MRCRLPLRGAVITSLSLAFPATAQTIPGAPILQVGPDQLVRTYMAAHHRALTMSMANPESDRLGFALHMA